MAGHLLLALGDTYIEAGDRVWYEGGGHYEMKRVQASPNANSRPGFLFLGTLTT